MTPERLDHFRTELQSRRHRLLRRISDGRAASDLTDLLRDVDAALDRLDQASFGKCDVCHKEVEGSDLDAHPLLTWCLCEMSDQQALWLQRDLNLATRIQRSLLPAPDMRFEQWWIDYRYLPLGPVSGDYCDAMTCSADGESLYFLLGDVSGKGVAASLTMARLSALFRSLIASGPTVSELVTRANELIPQGSGNTQYVTMIVGRAARNGEVSIANAGHVRPVLVQPNGAKTIEPGGKPLGLFPDPGVPAVSLKMQPGDTLFLCTDGLIEAANAEGEPYGEQRLVSLVHAHHRAAPSALIDAVLQDQARLRNGHAHTDDVSILVLRAMD
ncbi:MAG: PP2C family protein-serine/threonine phosphatase [Acidobacteriota bacterium]